MMSRLVELLLLVLFVLLVSSCIKDEPIVPTQVVSEEVVFVSGEIAILTGRVLSEVEISLSDHGFEISESDAFSNILTISLGELNVPGRFVAQTNELNVEKNYFARSYIVEDGETKYGQTLSFTTLQPQLVSYEPKVAAQGTQMTIVGIGLTEDTQVFFGDREITNFSFSFESIITFPIPELQDEYLIDISVVSQGRTLSFDESFEYIIGTWDIAGYLEDDDFSYGIINEYTDINYLHDDSGLLVINGVVEIEAVAGSDEINETAYNVDLLNFNSESLSFDIEHTVGGFQAYPYFGMGSVEVIGFNQGSLILSDKIYTYRTTGIELLTEAPEPLNDSVCNKVDNKLYIYGGENSDREKNRTIFIYDLDADTWTSSEPSPVDISNNLPYWSYNGNSYFVIRNKEIWEHNVTNDEWQIVSNYPGTIRDLGIATVLDDRVFIGMFDNTIDLFEVNANTFEKWRPKNTFSGGLGKSTIAMWTQDDRIYVLRNIRNEPLNFFSLKPDNF